MKSNRKTKLLTQPSDSTVRKHLRDLRELIDTSPDACERRIAQAMETGIRWARLKTVGWGNMAAEAKLLAQCLRTDLLWQHYVSWFG